MTEPAPLILSLEPDATSLARLEALRRRHFPPARNRTPAHLTLFHALPGEALEAITARLAAVAAATPVLPLAFTGPRSLGRGTAIAVESAPLHRLRAGLAEAWRPWLGAQDRQGFRPHATVQNKVTPEAARALLETLRQSLPPWEGTAQALLLWHYRGGPWEAGGRFPFTAPPPAPSAG